MSAPHPNARLRPVDSRAPRTERSLRAGRSIMLSVVDYARGGIRTHDLRLRRPTLYPAELLAQTEGSRSGRLPIKMVGASGFEPPTSWSRTRRANRTAPRPADLPASADGSDQGAPGETRTPNLLIRSQMLYPIELRARAAGSIKRQWRTRLMPRRPSAISRRKLSRHGALVK